MAQDILENPELYNLIHYNTPHAALTRELHEGAKKKGGCKKCLIQKSLTPAGTPRNSQMVLLRRYAASTMTKSVRRFIPTYVGVDNEYVTTLSDEALVAVMGL